MVDAAADRVVPRGLGAATDSLFTAEELAVDQRYRYSGAQIELATEVGILLGGAGRTTHLFGRRITALWRQAPDGAGPPRRGTADPPLLFRQLVRYKAQEGASAAADETCACNTYDLAIGRRLDNLPAVRERMRATNTRYLEVQAELLASTVDGGRWRARPVQSSARAASRA